LLIDVAAAAFQTEKVPGVARRACHSGARVVTLARWSSAEADVPAPCYVLRRAFFAITLRGSGRFANENPDVYDALWAGSLACCIVGTPLWCCDCYVSVTGMEDFEGRNAGYRAAVKGCAILLEDLRLPLYVHIAAL